VAPGRQNRRGDLGWTAHQAGDLQFVSGAGGRKIYISNEEGLTTAVKAGPEFEVLAENDLNEYTLRLAGAFRWPH
jgi:hypothetical protein